jgi:hypothetical protein
MKLFLFFLFSISFGLVGFVLFYPKNPTLKPVKQIIKTRKAYRCDCYRKNEFSKKLNNFLGEYIDRSSQEGIPASQDKSGLDPYILRGKLIPVKNNIGYELEDFHFSYAVLTPYAHGILKQIGLAFHDSLSHTPLANTQLLVTSMTRTQASVSRLMRRNRTAVKRSPHLNGNSFDFSFSRFISDRSLSDCERHYLQELSASILLHFKKEKKVWATFERQEECLHVVARKGK